MAEHRQLVVAHDHTLGQLDHTLRRSQPNAAVDREHVRKPRIHGCRVESRAVDLTLSPSEQAFRDELRTWLEANHPGQAPDGDESGFEFRRRWQRKLNEGGWAGLSWPTEYGGRGATLVEQAIFNEETVRARTPEVANVLGLVMGGPTVIRHGTEEQRKRYLPGILSADEIWCQGFSEPESGSDLASLKTRAVRDGDEWVVTGQKVWTTIAHHAKWCMLVARTNPDAPKHKGLTYFLMDMEQEAVQIRPLVQITGEAEFNELFIEEARIPHENIVGGEGNGWDVAITTLMHERAGLAFGLSVAVQITLDELIEKARSSHGNDGAVASEDPVIRQRLAQLLIESQVLRLNAYRGLSAIMRNGVPGPEGSLGKWHWSEVNQSMTELSMDIAGPHAMLDEGEWTYRFLRARANSIEGGTTEILRNIVAERVLGLPRMR
jgi:alkylation response protein AidB-like acyl-CoA dehydrogenase